MMTTTIVPLLKMAMIIPAWMTVFFQLLEAMEATAAISTYLYRDTYTWHTWLTNIYSYTHMYTHICTSFVCMVCGILFMRCLCKRFRNKCWIFNANIKQKIVFLLPDDLCERFIRVERICILDTFVSRDNNIKVFKGFYGEYLLDRR